MRLPPSPVTVSWSPVILRSGVGMRTVTLNLLPPRDPSPLDHVAFDGVHADALGGHPLQAALDLLQVALDLEHHPAPVLGDVGPPDVGDHVKLLPHLVDDGEGNQLLGEGELHALLRHLNLPYPPEPAKSAPSRCPRASSKEAMVGWMR